MKRFLVALCSLSVILGGCMTTNKQKPQPTSVKFDSVGGQLVKIPVTINGEIETSFLLDTGAGVNVISERLCEEICCSKSGSYTGKRMSGEEITLQFTNVPQIKVGDMEFEDTRAGVLGLFENLPDSLGRIDGAISLRFLEKTKFTIDYVSSAVILNDFGSVTGTAVPLEIERDEEKTMAFVQMKDAGLFEVDTGNSTAVLNLPKAELFQVDLEAKDVKKVEGKNETGFPFVAYYTKVSELQTLTGEFHIRIQKLPSKS
jgi:hypothetical protein